MQMRFYGVAPKIIPAQGRWVIAAYILIRNRRGGVLMLKRSQSSKYFPGMWELPGGKPVPGENLVDAAELEVLEETGLNVTPMGVVGAVEESMPGFRVIVLVLEGRTTKSAVSLSEEHDSYCWMPPAQVHSLRLRPAFNTFFARYLTSSRRKTSLRSSGKKG